MARSVLHVPKQGGRERERKKKKNESVISEIFAFHVPKPPTSFFEKLFPRTPRSVSNRELRTRELVSIDEKEDVFVSLLARLENIRKLERRSFV